MLGSFIYWYLEGCVQFSLVIKKKVLNKSLQHKIYLHLIDNFINEFSFLYRSSSIDSLIGMKAKNKKKFVKKIYEAALAIGSSTSLFVSFCSPVSDSFKTFLFSCKKQIQKKTKSFAGFVNNKNDFLFCFFVSDLVSVPEFTVYRLLVCACACNLTHSHNNKFFVI